MRKKRGDPIAVWGKLMGFNQWPIGRMNARKSCAMNLIDFRRIAVLPPSPFQKTIARTNTTGRSRCDDEKKGGRIERD